MSLLRPPAVSIGVANVLVTLDNPAAGGCVDSVLRKKPTFGGFVEFQSERDPVCHDRGELLVVDGRGRVKSQPVRGWTFARPHDGGPTVFVDAAKRQLLTVRRVVLDPGSDNVRGTIATEVTTRVPGADGFEAWLLMHLTAHHDRPEYAAAWRRGKAATEAWIRDWRRHTRYVMGDGNEHLMTLAGLPSCWVDQKPVPTGPGGGTIDAVWGRGLGKPKVIRNASDHNALVVPVTPTHRAA